MAPLTRSSQNANSRLEREDSWQHDTPAEETNGYYEEPGSGVMIHEDEAEEQHPFGPLGTPNGNDSLFLTSDAHQLLKPLQQTADRVSRQVEEFAKSLDRFISKKRNGDQQKLYDDACRLAETYSKASLARKGEIETTKASRARHLDRSILDAERREDEIEADKIQLEADLWSLLADLLHCSSPRRLDELHDSQRHAFGQLHRFSSEKDLWDAFLKSDTSGERSVIVVDWLQRRSAASKPNLDGKLAPILEEAQQAKGIWSDGWLSTKQSIKSIKRAHALKGPLDDKSAQEKPQSHRRNDNESLITQLDPDAPSRQNHVLEEKDELHEKAAWQAFWELLRRGEQPQSISSWYETRNETFRGLSLGCSRSGHCDKWSRFARADSNSRMLKVAQHLCSSGVEIDEYQMAVAGLFCGDKKASLGVCETLEDNLFVYFNAFIHSGYQNFLDQLQRSNHKGTYTPLKDSISEQLNAYYGFAKIDGSTAEEFRDPLRSIEAAMMTNDATKFLVAHGQALGQIPASSDLMTRLVKVILSAEQDSITQLAAQDEDVVRIIVHLQLLLEEIGYLDEVDTSVRIPLENNIAAYIGWLREHGKIAAIPLYASRLSKQRAAQVLGAVLLEIIDQKEKDLQISLMQQAKIDVGAVLSAQFSDTNEADLTELSNGSIKFVKTKAVEWVGPARARVPRIRREFLSGQELTTKEDHAIRTVEWFQYADRQHWGMVCKAACDLYQVFLLKGRLVAAEALSSRAPLSAISYAALGFDASDPSEIQNHTSKSPVKSSMKRMLSIPLTNGDSEKSNAELIELSKTWSQLEHLAMLMNGFDVFAEHQTELEISQKNKTQMHSSKSKVRDLLDELKARMQEILFAPEFLAEPVSGIEARNLDLIRSHYLCESVLAYHCSLEFAGRSLSRTELVECMLLGQKVALTPHLTEAFKTCKRMSELMQALAYSSQQLLAANELGPKKSDPRMEIWTVKYQGREEDVVK